MKIPTVEQSVSVQTPTVQPIQIPGAVSGAFGEREAEALQGFGQNISRVGEQLAQVVQIKNNQYIKEKEAELKTEYIKNWQKRLYSDNDITIKGADGEEYTAKEGYLFRISNQTAGITAESVTWENETRKSLLDKAPNERSKRELNNAFEGLNLGYQETLVRHEVTETRKAAEDNYKQTGLNLIDYAALGNSPQILSIAINQIRQNNENWMNRIGKGKAWLEQQNHDDIEKALWKATNGVLENTGDMESAKALLNDPALKDLIPEDLYSATEDKLNNAKSRIESVRKSLQIEKNINTTLDFLMAVNNGEIDWHNVDEVTKEINKTNPQLGQAMQKIAMIPAGVIYRGKDIDDLSYANSAQKMFEIRDNKTLNDYLYKLIREAPAGNLAQEKLTILLSLARNQAIANNPTLDNSQKMREDNNNLRNIVSYINKVVNPVAAPQMIFDLLKRKFANNLTGEQLKIEGQKVINQHILNRYPSVRGLNGIPNKVSDGDEGVETVYSGANQLTGEEYNGNNKSDTYRESSNEF